MRGAAADPGRGQDPGTPAAAGVFFAGEYFAGSVQQPGWMWKDGRHIMVMVTKVKNLKAYTITASLRVKTYQVYLLHSARM